MKYIFIDTNSGGTPSNATPDTATSIYHTSSSWPANGARWSTLAGALGNATARGITDDLTILCIGTAADTVTATTASMQCATLLIQGDLAGAVWNTGKYRISYTGAAANALILSAAACTGSGNFTLSNVQLEVNGTATGPIVLSCIPSIASSTFTVDSCIIRQGSTARTNATASSTGMQFGIGSTGLTLRVYNTIVYDIGSTSSVTVFGIRFNTSNAATGLVYNCVVQDITTGGAIARGIGANAGDTTTVKNCAVFDTLDDFNTIDTINYCAMDDADAGTGNINGLTWANEFEDYANGDFRLKAGSSLIGAGLDDPGSGLFSDDIAGTTRTDWDIGAFEYVGAGGSLSISLVGGDNEIYSSEADFEVRGTGLSAGQTFTIAGVACTELSFSSSTSVKLTAPNAISSNIKFGKREFKVNG